MAYRVAMTEPETEPATPDPSPAAERDEAPTPAPDSVGASTEPTSPVQGEGDLPADEAALTEPDEPTENPYTTGESITQDDVR